MNDTAPTEIEPLEPYPTARNGQRGRVLKQLREAKGIGQAHVGSLMGLTQPDVSRIEREVYGGMPRGFGARYLKAVATIAAARGGACFEKCGCTKRE